jgi:hypothetical protein
MALFIAFVILRLALSGVEGPAPPAHQTEESLSPGADPSSAKIAAAFRMTRLLLFQLYKLLTLN